MKRLLMIAASAALLAAPLTACSPTYSDGTRTGSVSKFSNKGLLCKYWEGELLLGGLRTTTNSDGVQGVAANIFTFNVKDDRTDVIADLKKAIETGERVTLTYNQAFIGTLCSTDTGYEVVNVKFPE